MAWTIEPPKGNGGGGGSVDTVNNVGVDAGTSNITLDALHIKVNKDKQPTVAQTLDNKADVGMLPLQAINYPLLQSDIGTDFSGIVLNTGNYNFASFNFVAELVFENGYKIKSTLENGFCIFNENDEVVSTLANSNGEMVTNSVNFADIGGDGFVITKNDYFLRNSDINEALMVTSDVSPERKVNGQWLLDSQMEAALFRLEKNRIVKKMNEIQAGDILSGSDVSFVNKDGSIPQNGAIVFQNGWELRTEADIGFGLFDNNGNLQSLWYSYGGSLRILEGYTFLPGLVDFKVVSNNLSDHSIDLNISILDTSTQSRGARSLTEVVYGKANVYNALVDKRFSIGNIPANYVPKLSDEPTIYFSRSMLHIDFSKKPDGTNPKIVFSNNDYIGVIEHAGVDEGSFGYVRASGTLPDIVFYDANGNLFRLIKDEDYKYKLPVNLHVVSNDFNDETYGMQECQAMQFGIKLFYDVNPEYNFKHGIKSVNDITVESSGGSEGNLRLTAIDVKARPAPNSRKDGKVTDEDDSDVQTQLNARAEIYYKDVEAKKPLYALSVGEEVSNLVFETIDIKSFNTDEHLVLKCYLNDAPTAENFILKYDAASYQGIGFTFYTEIGNTPVYSMVPFYTKGGIWRYNEFSLNQEVLPYNKYVVLENTFTNQNQTALQVFSLLPPVEHAIDCHYNDTVLEEKVDLVEVMEEENIQMFRWSPKFDDNFSGITITAEPLPPNPSFAENGTMCRFSNEYAIRTLITTTPDWIARVDVIDINNNNQVLFKLYDTDAPSEAPVTYTFPSTPTTINVASNNYDVGCVEAELITFYKQVPVKADMPYVLNMIAGMEGGGGSGGDTLWEKNGSAINPVPGINSVNVPALKIDNTTAAKVYNTTDEDNNPIIVDPEQIYKNPPPWYTPVEPPELFVPTQIKVYGGTANFVQRGVDGGVDPYCIRNGAYSLPPPPQDSSNYVAVVADTETPGVISLYNLVGAPENFSWNKLYDFEHDSGFVDYMLLEQTLDDNNYYWDGNKFVLYIAPVNLPIATETRLGGIKVPQTSPVKVDSITGNINIGLTSATGGVSWQAGTAGYSGLGVNTIDNTLSVRLHSARSYTDKSISTNSSGLTTDGGTASTAGLRVKLYSNPNVAQGAGSPTETYGLYSGLMLDNSATAYAGLRVRLGNATTFPYINNYPILCSISHKCDVSNCSTCREFCKTICYMIWVVST
ncbi:hypothetical protein AGMMS49592_0260 [Endomicrobiia bacterium]|nr:hypothetical protein AGMMS49592_0260 [Endomicrobiia bacterium]